MEEDHEDAFLTKNYWYEMLKTGNYHQVPVLMGTNLNETLFFLQGESMNSGNLIKNSQGEEMQSSYVIIRNINYAYILL